MSTLATNVSVDVRREHEQALLRTYHQSLLALGVSEAAYSWERCWLDYLLQLWRPFVAILTLCPNFAEQRRSRTGMFSEAPTQADATLLRMYSEFNQRLVAALLDHKYAQVGAGSAGRV